MIQECDPNAVYVLVWTQMSDMRAEDFIGPLIQEHVQATKYI